MRGRTISLAMIVMTAAIACAKAPSTSSLVKPTPEQAAWQDMEIGLFIHYDLTVFKPGWDHRQYDSRPGP